MSDAVTGNARLFARIVELEKDQRRLEWLVANEALLQVDEDFGFAWVCDKYLSGSWPTRPTWRDAIDAAMAQQEDK